MDFAECICYNGFRDATVSKSTLFETVFLYAKKPHSRYYQSLEWG